MFNNNGRSTMPSLGGLAGLDPTRWQAIPTKGLVAQAPANAMMLRKALAQASVPVAAP